METTPHFMTGVFALTGQGLDAPAAIAGLSYRIPADKRAQPIYFRAGNSCGEMIALHLLKDGNPMRTFPVGAKGAMHVPLAVVEDIMPDSVLTLAVAAPAGASGHVVLDIGLIEI